MLALASGLGILGYGMLYYGWLAVQGFPALVGFTGSQANPSTAPASIKFLDVMLPSHLGTLEQFLAAGAQSAGKSSPSSSSQGGAAQKTYQGQPKSQLPAGAHPGR